MERLATVVLFFAIHNCLGQDILAYYAQINKARLLAVEAKYEQAARAYKQAFETIDVGFARDCVHAVEVSSMAGNDSLTYYFIRCGLSRGIPISYFDQKAGLGNVRSSPFWPMIQEEAHALQEAYELSINEGLREEINEMFEADQRIRKRYYHWANFLLRPIFDKKWENLNRNQVNRMVQITQTYGFPGERLIGIDLPAFHEKIDVDQFSAGMPILIFIHHYSQPNVSHDSLLLEEVLKGNLYHEHFATICDYEVKFGKGKYSNLGPYGQVQGLLKLDVGQVNTRRAHIGLLQLGQLQQLNALKGLTHFWNRLY
ncbi:MAG: hypothetical protein AAGI38_21610 [Bacteroidota bacterium]